MAKKDFMDMSLEELGNVDVEKAAEEHNKPIREKKLADSRKRIDEIKADSAKRKAALEAEKNRPSWVQRLKAKVQKKLKSDKPKTSETTRTKAVSDQLKASGMTDDEINKLKGKK